MNNRIANVLTFTIGLFIGSVVTYKFVKTKYEQIAQEEIDSVKEVFLAREIDREEREGDEDLFGDKELDDQINIEQYNDILSKEKYAENNEEERSGERYVPDGKPYAISPEEFDELYGYSTRALNYYQEDGVVTDEYDEIIDPADVADIVGDFRSGIGEYHAFAIYIRNDDLKTDYEIAIELRAYSDLHGHSPSKND